MPIVFVWGNGRSPVLAALGGDACLRERDAQARLVAAENGDFEVAPGSEHGISPRWAHAFDIEDVEEFAENIRDDMAIVEWCPEDADEGDSTLPLGAAQVIYPFIRYRDAVKALDWLSAAFGFEEAFRVPAPGGGIAHAQIFVGAARIMISSLRDDDLNVKTPQDAGGVTSFLHVAIEEPDQHCDRARAAGAEILHPPADTGQRSRGYTARDLEGHIWRFDTYAP